MKGKEITMACTRIGMGGMAAFGGAREEEEADEQEEVGFSILAAFSLAVCTHRQEVRHPQ